MLRLQSVTPATLAMVLLSAAFAILSVCFIVIDNAGEAIIATHQRLVAETARDDFVAFALQEGLSPLAKALDSRAEPQSGAFSYALYDDAGNLLGGSRLLPAAGLPGPGYSVHAIGDGDRAQRYEILIHPISLGGTLAIFENLSERDEFRGTILYSFAIALIASTAAIAGISLWFGQVLVSRAAGISAAAQRISHGDLSARAPVRKSGDVFDKLGLAVNAMLERIEELLTGLQTVTDSLAHDLRSPLARLRASLTRALDPSIGKPERLTLIEDAQKDSETVLATFAALLDIARAESGLSREMMAPLDLTALVAAMGELFEPVLEDAGQSFTVQVPATPVIANVHELLLRQALGNLLHNAARYAGKVPVQLALRHESHVAYLTVADKGPGIPPSQRGRVQERFIRLDTSRGSPGSGLGLAIAAACAKLHGGRLTLEDNAPGVRAVLALPIQNASERS